MSFFKLAEQYFALVRRVSRLHPRIMNKFQKEINTLMVQIDEMMQSNGRSKELVKNELMQFRSAIFKLQDLLDVNVMDEYNKILDANNEYQETKKEEDKKDDNNLPEDLWEDLKAYLESKMNKAAYAVWVKPTRFLSIEDNKIKVKVDNFFYKRFLEDNCSPLIRKYIDDKKLPYDVDFVA